MRNKAFTMSEVLITLGVIGVVASLTLPALIQNYQKQVVVTQLKRAYSDFSQAIQKAEVEHGLMETWDFDVNNFESYAAQNQYFAKNYLLPYIKTVKTCMPTSNACWADSVVTLNGSVYNNLDNNAIYGNSSFITASGYSVNYWLHRVGTGMHYWIDINGPKKPNKVGKDIFDFNASWGVSRGKLLPSGAGLEHSELTNPNNRYACVKGNSSTGQYCAALIMLDGWKIDKDYPW